VFRCLKTQGCVVVFFSIFKNQLIVVKNDKINVVKDILPLFVKRIANSLDLGDFRQIILYFGLSK